MPLVCHEEEVLFETLDLPGASNLLLQPSLDDKHLSDCGSWPKQELHVYDCPNHESTGQSWAKHVLAAAPVTVIRCVWSQDSSQLLYQTMDTEGNTQVQPLHVVMSFAFAWCC